MLIKCYLSAHTNKQKVVLWFFAILVVCCQQFYTVPNTARAHITHNTQHTRTKHQTPNQNIQNQASQPGLLLARVMRLNVRAVEVLVDEDEDEDVVGEGDGDGELVVLVVVVVVCVFVLFCSIVYCSLQRFLSLFASSQSIPACTTTS
jgi:hypothetical protein